MPIDFWRGKRVHLRAVEPEDGEEFYAWNSDTESARDAYDIPFPESLEAAKKWASD